MKSKFRIAIAFVISAALLAGCSYAQNGIPTTVSDTPSGDDSAQAEKTPSSGINEDSEEITDNSGHHTIEEKNVPYYVCDAEHKEDINLYYVDGSTVPYISIETVLDLSQNIHMMRLLMI